MDPASVIRVRGATGGSVGVTTTEWTVAIADESMVAAHIQNLLVLSWRTGARMEHVESVAQLQRQLVRGGLAPLSVINIFSLEAAGGIPEELRRRGRALYEEMLPHYRAQAYVIMGQGFWAAGIRAFLAAFTALTSRKLDTKTFGRLDDTVEWLGGLDGQPDWMRSEDPGLAWEIEHLVLGAHCSGAAA